MRGPRSCGGCSGAGSSPGAPSSPEKGVRTARVGKLRQALGSERRWGRAGVADAADSPCHPVPGQTGPAGCCCRLPAQPRPAPRRVSAHGGDSQASCSPDLGMGVRRHILHPPVISPRAVLCRVWLQALSREFTALEGGDRQSFKHPCEKMGFHCCAQSGGSWAQRESPGTRRKGAHGTAEIIGKNLICVPSWSRSGSQGSTVLPSWC